MVRRPIEKEPVSVTEWKKVEHDTHLRKRFGFLFSERHKLEIVAVVIVTLIISGGFYYMLRTTPTAEEQRISDEDRLRQNALEPLLEKNTNITNVDVAKTHQEIEDVMNKQNKTEMTNKGALREEVIQPLYKKN